MGITEEILKKKREQKNNKEQDATEDNSSITQMLLQRRKAGLRAMPSPAESVGAGTALFGPLAEARENQAKKLLGESVNIFLENKRQNAPSPTQAVQQLGLNVSPVTTMELPTATEPDYVAQALEDNGRLEEIQQDIQAAKQTQWDNPLPKGVASGLKFAQTMRENPEEGLKQVRANLEAQDQVKALTREQDRIQYIRSNAGKTYEDNFFGQFGASYALGRMRQDESLAWNKYLEDQTEENRAYAEAIGQLANKFEQENKATLAPDATLPWISQSLANYLPQFWDQVKYGAVGAIGGAAAGSAVPVLGTAAGIKAGITAASGLYSYQTMRGAAFKTLLDLGASEEVAREAAGDEAVVSSLIEMADTGIDLLTLGGGKLISAITKGGVKNLAKEGAEKAAESAGKKLLKALGKYGVNVAGEFTEEATQQAVSIANANRVEAGVDNGILGLMADAGYGVLWEAAENADDPNRAEILKAGFQGAIVAGLMGPMQAGFNQLAFTGLRTMDNKVSADYGQQLRQQGFDGVAIEAGMKFPEGSGVYNMAQALQQKQQAGQEITDVELGDLYRSIKLGAQQELQNTVQTARSEAARQRSMESGILLPTADDLEVIGTTESRVRETGMLAGAREADIESAERISQAMGRNVEFFREEAGQAGTVNGFYDANTGTIYINSQSQNPVAQIIAHELTHSVEMAESYQELKTLALEQLERDGVNLEERRQQVLDLYQRNGKILAGNEEIDSELVAQFVETKLLTDEATIMELTRTNRPLMERVLNWINRTLQQLGLKKTTERDTLERAREIYAKALRETQMQKEAAVTEVQETGTREVVRNAEQLEQQETMDQEQLERKELEQEYRNVIQMIRKSLESGSITEEEFDATFDAILEDASRDGIDLLNERSMSISENVVTKKKKFSLSEPVEQTKDLLALHNLSQENLRGAFKLGGFPMPSIAVIRDTMQHDRYGDITLVFGRSTVDPQMNMYNRVYGGDAWTPSFPRVEYQADQKALDKIEKRIDQVLPREMRNQFGRPLSLDADNVEDNLNRWNGNLEEAYKDNDVLRYVFVKEKDPSFQAQSTTEKLGKISGHDDAVIISLGDFLGYDKIREMREQGYRGFEGNEALRNEMIEIINQVYEEQYGDGAKNLYSEMAFSDYNRLIDDIYRYFRNGKKANQIIDAQETRAAVNQAINQEEYLQWVRDLFRDVVKNVGIRNEKDLFTPSGNRRSFNALHYELTLENAVRVMRKDIQKGGGAFFGGGAIWGVATKDYGSISELRQDKNRLQVMDEKAYEDLRGQYTQRLVDICSEIIKPGENRFIAMDGAADAIIDALRTKKTRAAIDRELRSYSFLNIKPDTAQKALDLVSDIKKMPTEYFEAKPQRAVYFSEILAAVVPDNADQDIKEGLAKERIKTLEYKAGDTNSRMKAVNSVEGAKFSISESTDSQGRELSPEQVEFFRDSKVRDEDGRLKVMYHGTPYGGFTVFREGTYFTDNPKYAEVYHSPSASSIRGRYDPGTLPMTYAVYLNIKMPFDTRNEDAREIFYREYYRQYGMGTDLQESGLPDWLDAEDLREFLEENEYDYDGLIVDEGGTGGYDQEVRKRGLAYIAFRPDQIKQVANRNPTSNPDIRYSVSDDQQQEMDGTITLPTADSESQMLRDQLPVKAKKYLQRAERSMMNTIGQSLSIPYRARRDILTGTVQQMSEEYLQTGRVSEETRQSLFEEAYEAGIVQDREFLDQYQGLRDYLRDTTLQISKKDSADIPDFHDYRRRNFGRLNISTSGGTNIDQVYKELSELWPEFFNESRESTPSDQLNRISEVVKNFQVTERSLDEYYGPEAETFKRFAYHDFSAAIDEQLQELQAVRRYQEQSQRQQQREEDQKPKTIQEVVQLWDKFKQEKKRYEKVAAKNLLTEEDERLVGQLLRGEITELALDQETNNVKGILAVYESKREFDRIAKQLREWNADRRNALKKLADQYLTTANGWKDKRSGILYSRETMERNIRDIVPDEALAQSIIDEYFTPVHKGTAAATRMKNGFRQRVKDMNLSRDIAKGNIVSEAHAVQLLGEAEDNIRYMEKAKWTRERDGKTIDEWRQVVADLWKENPNLDQKKIQDAVNKFRLMYDELFQKMNEVRVRNGYEPINYRSGYFPHFQPGDGDGIIAAFGRALGISTEVTALPTSINGLTHTFKPGIQWFGNAQERLGFNTAYDAVEGFDKYIEGVADVVHHTDNIQKLRQLANQVRYRTTSEGIRKQVDAVLANDSLSEIDKQNRIEKIYESGKFSLSNFVVELEEYTNLLANKKSRHDRSVETDAGRAVYNLVKTLEGRVAANMVSINPASWLTNFIPLAQGNALLGRGRLLKGMWDTLRSYKENDGFVEQSTFLTNRRGSDPLVKSWQKGEMPASGAARSIRKIGDAVGRFGDIAPQGMVLIDNFVSDSLVRARYAQNLEKGMSEASAMDEADNWTAGVMADRSKGSMPTLFMRKNPITKLATQFQLEVNNQLSYLFKDIPRETKQAGMKVLTWALVKFAVGAWLYDEIYEYLIGRRPALDPIGILNDTVGDLTGWELPNLVELGVGAVTGDMPEFRTEKTSLYDAAANLGAEVLEQVPFTGALNWIGADLDAGRLPISNAIPDIGNMVKALTDSELPANKRADLFLRELADTAGAYLVLPYGGGQLKKILQTAEAVVRGGRYSVNNEGELQLQYPVFNDEATDIAGNAIWGSAFGPTTLPTGREWIENGFGTLSVDQTIAYEAMKEAGAEDETAFQVIQDYRAAEDNEARREVIRNADINGEAKAALYYQLMASDTERQQLDLLDDAGQDMGQIIDTLLDIKDMDEAAREDSETDEEKPLFDEKQVEAITAAGLKENDAALAAVERENIWANRDLTTDEKKAEFSRWLNEQDYSADEQHALYNAIIEGGESESEAGQENRYARLVSSGIDDDIAYAITSDISRLEPVEGAETVSREQKRAVVFERIADPEQQLAALETINLESQQKKFEVAYKNGVKPEVYAAVIAELPNYDKDGNGSLNQEEVTNALNSMGRGALTLPGGANDFTLSTQDKAVIWQLCNKSWKSKNNPFGSGVGSRVYNALNAE